MSTANGQSIAVCGNIFRLVETIGRGSYGTVHKATNLSSGAAVAIKLIAKDKLRRPHERQSIEKEIETMRVAVEQYENGHPHIVRLLCTKESQHHIFIVLEYCAGGDIAQVIKTQQGVSEDQARSYMAQLASGLQFLRSQNVVHRDLKPANLLLSSKNISTAKLKIADFGFARELQQEMLAESVVGSPLYMAPELLEYKSYDAKADLWSVGIILYEMLANDHPFLLVENCHATNHLALRRNIHRYFRHNDHVRLPAELSVSAECAELIAGLLRVNPQERFSFEDFFRAEFLLPPLPTRDSENEVDSDSANLLNKHALIADEQLHYAEDWATFSEEYVIVEKEYEDVGRKVLDSKDLSVHMIEQLPVESTTNLETHANIQESKASMECHDTTSELPNVLNSSQAIVVDSGIEDSVSELDKTISDPKKKVSIEQVLSYMPETSTSSAPKNTILITQQLAEALISEGKRERTPEGRELEDFLGISYRSFACGSVALFVPTPFGDYIAFHEGCPHYYLSDESIEAFKRDERNPPYVLGFIVYIEDYVTTKESKPYCLREGMRYHVVTVAPLSSSDMSNAHNGDGVTEALPLSQKLAALSTPTASGSPLSPPHEANYQTSDRSTTSSQPSLSSGSITIYQHQRISFRKFQINHLALFFLKGGKLPYVAFNEGMPNYFLSSEAIQAARMNEKKEEQNQFPAYICGEIIFIDTFQATEDFNPYRLPYGTRFHVVTVANAKRT
uniref:Protein kinase putative n=1 Tax=Albugo laibachii Nc14 TaxID=890382 RepID=F0VZZ1_9STRA|nr:protein kinase putative [Albugo laibachii Nc14]|eukprot:CCA14362.1 protein kinase putative [Albugo laibachii Nc14]